MAALTKRGIDSSTKNPIIMASDGWGAAAGVADGVLTKMQDEVGAASTIRGFDSTHHTTSLPRGMRIRALEAVHVDARRLREK